MRHQVIYYLSIRTILYFLELSSGLFQSNCAISESLVFFGLTKPATDMVLIVYIDALCYFIVC